MISRTQETGRVLWITGLSGAGKSVIAQRTYELLKTQIPNAVLIDGDVFRALMADDLGHSLEDRRRNAFRIARLCRFLSHSGIHVVCATMSLFHECQEWNREQIPGYFEVFVEVPLEKLIQRDSKQLYSRALRGEIEDVVGIQLPYEAPKQPEMTLQNSVFRNDFTEIALNILNRAGYALPVQELLAQALCAA